jgi:hypothetical protein
LASIINSTDTGSGGLITTGDSSDELQIQTAETTALTITSGQQSVFIAGTAAAPAVTTTGDLNTGIYFPAADNIGFATGGTIRGRWTTDGLCFGSDTAAANALDDYEEGTWTPVLAGREGTVSGQSYSDQTGKYTKIGNVVYWSCSVTLSAEGSPGTGFAGIRGLPFTVSGNNGTSGSISAFTNTGQNYVFISILYVNGETNASFRVTTAAASSASIVDPASDFYTNTTGIGASGFYYVS